MKNSHTYLFAFLLILFVNYAYSQTEACLDCHNDDELSKERNGKEISLFVSDTTFHNSIHGDLECVDCHLDFDPEEEPHKQGKDIYKVDCTECHDDLDMDNGIHFDKKLQCFECHGWHDIKEGESLLKDEVKFCGTCHSKKTISMYQKSTHYLKDQDGKSNAMCTDCHGSSVHEIESAKFQRDDLYKTCGKCHSDEVEKYKKSLHGQALDQEKYLAPNCITCHNGHEVLSSKAKDSKTYRMNIPALCGQCHKDGTKVSELKVITKKHILGNYTQSIHGDGIFKRGLIVSAVCSDCHFQHNILPHENPESSINRNNIAKTCTKCHVSIEKVHLKVIRGELWEKKPHLIPACVDCHMPHKIRRVFYEQEFSNNKCMECHSDPKLFKMEGGIKVSLYVDSADFEYSAHKDNSCVKCHSNVSISKNPVCIGSGKVDCSACHAEAVADYNLSIHGKMFKKNDPDAPGCVDCHGTHGIMSKKLMNSPIFSKNIPNLCAKCHRSGEKAAIRMEAENNKNTRVIEKYEMSIHGKGLLNSGLLVTATCVNCHTNHGELPAQDSTSSVNSKNIAKTCAACHLGIYEDFKKSIHSPGVAKTDKKLPGCADCHESHTIERVDIDDFRLQIIQECGKCHEEVTETYFDTFHGKVSKLGDVQAARCYDCHGSHKILPPSNPESSLSHGNIVQTCKKCHTNSNRKFVGYLTHATHHDQEKYPYLYFTFWAMTLLLLGTFSFFGLHTLLWFSRSMLEKRKTKNKGHNDGK